MAKSNKNNQSDVIEINLKEYMTPIALIFGSILISVTLLVSLLSINSSIKKLDGYNSDVAGTNEDGNGDTAAAGNTAPTNGKTSIDDDPILGNKDKAKIAIVEFSDYVCPYCKRFHDDTFDQIKKEYIDSNKAIFVYRDLPLSGHEPNATTDAIAAECVQEYGNNEKYYKYADLLFNNSTADNSKLADLAGQVGVDKDKFAKCLSERKFEAEVQKDAADASTAGIDGTPGFIIGVVDKDGNVDGETVSGAQPYASFKAAIDRQLARAK